MRCLKISLLLAALALIAAPPVQSVFPFISEKPLHGYEESKPAFSLQFFTWRRWFAGEFQLAASNRFNNHPGFRNSLIRVFSQADYSLFGLTHAPGFIRGKGGNLFEEDYIHEYLGAFFIGQKTIDRKMIRLKSVYDSLKARNISLVLVFEPGKASVFPEDIPERFRKKRFGPTNYEWFTARARSIGLPYLDLNRYFIRTSGTSRYPLFPKYGMHWSVYGAAVAADTLAGYIGAVRNIRVPRFTINNTEVAGKTRAGDNDIADILNLLFPLPATPGAYPQTRFRNDSGTVKPSVLVISDSFYEYIFYPYGEQMFRNQQFWYYNSRLFPHQNSETPVFADKTGLLQKLTGYEVILLMVSEINLHCGFWNFADEAWLAFHPDASEDHVYRIANGIRNDRNWFRGMVKGAAQKKVSLEQYIQWNAEYAFSQDFSRLENKTMRDSLVYIALDIRNNPEWFAAVKKQALEHNLPLDTMLNRAARFVYAESKQKH
jgi:hypothetical protein